MILFRAKNFDDKITVLDTEYFRLFEIYPFSIKRCTGILDGKNVLIFEGDELEVYTKNGDLLYSGTVIYSTRKGAFILVDEKWANITDIPIGELIKDRTAYVVKPIKS